MPALLRLLAIGIFFFFLETKTAVSQDLLIWATITDEITHQPVIGCKVDLIKSKQHAVTDTAGEFVLKKVGVDQDTLLVQCSGYRDIRSIILFRQDSVMLEETKLPDVIADPDQGSRRKHRRMCCSQLEISPEPGVVYGRITDLREGLPGIVVTLHDTTAAALKLGNAIYGADTYYDGKYVMQKVKPGIYVMRTSGVGYKTQRITVNVGANHGAVCNFILDEEPPLPGHGCPIYRPPPVKRK
jgi:hypothetical protein